MKTEITGTTITLESKEDLLALLTGGFGGINIFHAYEETPDIVAIGKTATMFTCHPLSINPLPMLVMLEAIADELEKEDICFMRDREPDLHQRFCDVTGRISRQKDRMQKKVDIWRREYPLEGEQA